MHIVLARGQHPSQPMLTRRSQGTLESELAAAKAVVAELRCEGFQAVRIKIEAAPWNGDVPTADGEAAGFRECYFEHHAKLLLEPGADCARLRSIAEQHGAHLSRNALRSREDGRQERFVTQRRYSAGRETARRQLGELLAALRPLGHAVLEVEEEYVVYDSDPQVDAGWIAEGAHSWKR